MADTKDATDAAQGMPEAVDDAKPQGQSLKVDHEAVRLKNIISTKEKELEESRREITALRAQLSTKERALSASDLEMRVLKERVTATEGEVANMAKELAALKVEKRKLESQMAGLLRKGATEQSTAVIAAAEAKAAAAEAKDDASAKASNGTAAPSAPANPVPPNEHVATLQADLRMARMDGEKAQETVRALENLLRAKDKHINALQRKADEADGLRMKCLEFENKLLEAGKQLDELRAEGRTKEDVLRTRDGEKARLQGELDKAKAALEAAAEAAARQGASLKASETRGSALEQEVSVLVGQLARTSAVAQRVAVAEVKAGCKDEGTVHVTRHLEEVRFMSGEVARLQTRIGQLEKELAVAHELKEKYKDQVTTAGLTPASPSASPGPGLPGSRPSSRPSSAQRRPVSASASPAPTARTARPVSAPRSAVRASTNSIPAGMGAAAAAGASPSPADNRPSSRGRVPGVRTSFSGLPMGGQAATGAASGMRRSPRPQPWEAQLSPAKSPTAAAAKRKDGPAPEAAAAAANGAAPAAEGGDASAPAAEGAAAPAVPAPGTGAVRPSTPNRGSRPGSASAAAAKPLSLPPFRSGVSPVAKPVTAAAAQARAVANARSAPAPRQGSVGGAPPAAAATEPAQAADAGLQTDAPSALAALKSNASGPKSPGAGPKGPAKSPTGAGKGFEAGSTKDAETETGESKEAVETKETGAGPDAEAEPEAVPEAVDPPQEEVAAS